jgi:hypothetical protein
MNLDAQKRIKRLNTLQHGLVMPFDYFINVILSCGRCHHNTSFQLIRSQTRLIVHIKGKYSPIIGIIPDMLYLISKVDRPIIPNYQPPPSLFLDIHRFSLQSPLYGSHGSVGKGKEPTHIIVTISDSD